MITVTGRVLDHEGEPVPHATVRATPTPGASVRGDVVHVAPVRVRADGEGRFSLAVVHVPGLAYAVASGSGWAFPDGLILHCDSWPDGSTVTVSDLVTVAEEGPVEPVTVGTLRAEMHRIAKGDPGDPGSPGASVVGGEDNGDGTVSFILSDGTRTEPVHVPPGPAGPSPYQLALKDGFVGTESEWLASLKSTTPGPMPTLDLRVSTLPPGADASIDVTDTSGGYRATIGVPEGERGETGPAPRLSATSSTLAPGESATATATEMAPGVYRLNLGIPRGVKGDPGGQGDAGPAPALSARASTLAETEQATASATLVSPGSYRLDLGIPRGLPGGKGDKGDTGAPGAVGTPASYFLTGPGRPDVPSTTGGVIAGGEPIGATFASTDGAGVGAWAWRKRPNGWVVTDGDTGRRDITAMWQEVNPGLTGLVTVRRINDTVYLAFETEGWGWGAGPNQLNLQAGFAPPSRIYVPLPTADGTANRGPLYVDSGWSQITRLSFYWNFQNLAPIIASWPAAFRAFQGQPPIAWPSTLPGQST